MSRFIYLLSTLLALTALALGQTPNNQNSAPANQKKDEQKTELPPIRESVTVTATRGETTVENSPVSTSVVTLQENRIRNIQTLDQSLNLIEGVYAFRTKGPADTNTRVLMRGFNGQNRTLVLLDGQPVNDAYTGEVAWTSLPINEVDRIEVARGAFSSLYGGNALGGVINILTRPIERRELELSGQYGAYDSTNYSARYSDRFFDKLGASIGYQRLQTGGFNTRPIQASAATGTGGTLVTGVIPNLTTGGARIYDIGRAGDNWYNQHAGRIKLDLAATSATQISFQYIGQFSAYGYDNYASFLRDANGNVVDRGPALFNDNGVTRRLNFTPGSFTPGPGQARSTFLNGSVLHKFGANTFLKLSAGAYDQPDNTSRTPTTATATQSSGPGSISYRASRNYYGNAQFNWQPGFWSGRNGFVFGAESRQERSANDEFALTNWQVKQSVANQTYSSFGQTFNQAFYAQDQLRLRDNITVVAGLRYDYWRAYDGFFNGYTAATPLAKYPNRTSHAVTGKVAAAYQPIAGLTLRASVGNAFRNPTVLELYRSFRLSSGTLFLANPALEPERLFSYEFGVRKQFGQSTELEATYYRNQITNLIYRKTAFELDATGATRLNVNAGAGTTNGVEVAARQRLLKGLQLRASYTYTDAIISRNPALVTTEGKRVPNIPAQMVTGSLLGAWKRFTGSLNARYVGTSFSTDINSDTTKGVYGSYSPFFTLDASAGFAVRRGVDLFVSAENLLDRQYYLFYLNPGRAVYGGVRLRWGGAK